MAAAVGLMPAAANCSITSGRNAATSRWTQPAQPRAIAPDPIARLHRIVAAPAAAPVPLTPSSELITRMMSRIVTLDLRIRATPAARTCSRNLYEARSTGASATPSTRPASTDAFTSWPRSGAQPLSTNNIDAPGAAPRFTGNAAPLAFDHHARVNQALLRQFQNPWRSSIPADRAECAADHQRTLPRRPLPHRCGQTNRELFFPDILYQV